MNKKAIALFLSKPILWLVFALIIVLFLILFTIGGMGSSGSDQSIVSKEMPGFISTIEAMNYLRTPIGEFTSYDILLRSLKQLDSKEEDKIDYNLLGRETAGLLRIKKIKLEDEAYTIILDVNKPGEYKKIKEVELYVPSNLNNHDYLKLILNIPYKEKNE